MSATAADSTCTRTLPLAPGIDLYLLACYQGQKLIRQKWVAETKATVHGCESETESALSTLFLLALLEHGPESAAHWFERWREANDRLRPHFPEMRRLYEDYAEEKQMPKFTSSSFPGNGIRLTISA